MTYGWSTMSNPREPARSPMLIMGHIVVQDVWLKCSPGNLCKKLFWSRVTWYHVIWPYNYKEVCKLSYKGFFSFLLSRIIQTWQFLFQFLSDFGCRGPETARYQTIFRSAATYELLIIEFQICFIIIKYQLKFQIIINTVYFLFIHQYL